MSVFDEDTNTVTPRCAECVRCNCGKGCHCDCHGYKWKR